MSTIAKALRERKTLGNTIATAKQRAISGAVSEKDKKTDFNTAEYIIAFHDAQLELRKLKTAIAEKTASTLVTIPVDVPCPEAGTQVTLYQAILIRDDLKALKQFNEHLVGLPVRDDYRWRGEAQEVVEKVRNFDFDGTVELIDKIQDSIDAVDAVIQYVDNTEEI